MQDHADPSNRESEAPSPRRVLVVADDPLQASLLADRLSGSYLVTSTHNAAEACELARHRAFPVVIVDCRLHDMSDLQTLDQFRNQQIERCYLIARSVLGTVQERELSILCGADDHISKLLPFSELIARIEAGFEANARREGQRLTRLMRACGAAPGRNLDTDEWKVSATRLHHEMLHAARDKKPLSVFVVHVERQLVPRDRPLLTFTQFLSLAGALDSILKLNSDIALPLDASDGVVRLLVVLHETKFEDAVAIRNRLRRKIVEAVVDESSASIVDDTGVHPDCSIGLAAVETWETATVTNAAELVALAEQSMEKLPLRA